MQLQRLWEEECRGPWAAQALLPAPCLLTGRSLLGSPGAISYL